MKTCMHFALLILFGLFCNVQGALYAIITETGGGGSQTVIWTVSVDPTSGAFTQLVENIIVVGTSTFYDGISAYDQKKNFLYYATNFEGPYVYSVDIANKEILPLVTITSESVNAIDWDGTNQQILILGVFEDHSSAVYTYPYNGSSIQVVNFTAQGIPTPLTTFLDWAKGVYYFIFYNPTKTQFFLGSFPTATPKTVQTTALNFEKTFTPDYLFLSSSGTIFGVGRNETTKTNQFFTIATSGAITVADFGLNGIVTAATFDPKANILYLGYQDKATNAASLITVDSTSGKLLKQIPTLRILEDLQVTYQV